MLCSFTETLPMSSGSEESCIFILNVTLLTLKSSDNLSASHYLRAPLSNSSDYLVFRSPNEKALNIGVVNDLKDLSSLVALNLFYDLVSREHFRQQQVSASDALGTLQGCPEKIEQFLSLG